MGDGVSLPIPPQLGCHECILTHITLYLNQKGGKSRAKLVGSSWYLTPLLWDTPRGPANGMALHPHGKADHHGLSPLDRTFVFLYPCLQRNLIKKTILGNIPNMDVVHHILLTHVHQLPWNRPYRLKVRGNRWSASGALKKPLRLRHLPARIRRRRAHLCFRGPRAPLLVLEAVDIQLQEESTLCARNGAFFP